VRRKPQLRQAWTEREGPAVAASVGPFALGHVATKSDKWGRQVPAPGRQCTAGLYVLHTFHPVDGGKYGDATASIRQYVRCRKCDGCRSFKRAMWTARAITESLATAARGRRTWVLTCTHRIRPSTGGDDLFAREITLALKRLRKLVAFRYLCIFERHKPKSGEKQGYPHCHMLIHEVGKVLYSDIVLAFSRVGFFKANLLKGEPHKAAGYVGKYMTKDETTARVRASINYGEDPGTLEPPECPDTTSTIVEYIKNTLPERTTKPDATAPTKTTS